MRLVLSLVLCALVYLSTVSGSTSQNTSSDTWMLKGSRSGNVILLDMCQTAQSLVSPANPKNAATNVEVTTKITERHLSALSFDERFIAARKSAPLRIVNRTTSADSRARLALVSGNYFPTKKNGPMGDIRVCWNFYGAPIPCHY